jgi:hypothetical protein
MYRRSAEYSAQVFIMCIIQAGNKHDRWCKLQYIFVVDTHTHTHAHAHAHAHTHTQVRVGHKYVYMV